MKRLIAAVSFAVLASPVLATPFEQTQLDRQLPQVVSPVAAPERSSASLPFEQTQFDRAVAGEESRRYAQYAAATLSDRDIATDASAQSSFADDHNFIAPAQ